MGPTANTRHEQIRTDTSVLVRAVIQGRGANLHVVVLRHALCIKESHQADAAVRSVCQVRLVLWLDWYILLSILQVAADNSLSICPPTCS